MFLLICTVVNGLLFPGILKFIVSVAIIIGAENKRNNGEGNILIIIAEILSVVIAILCVVYFIVSIQSISSIVNQIK